LFGASTTSLFGASGFGGGSVERRSGAAIRVRRTRFGRQTRLLGLAHVNPAVLKDRHGH